MTKIVHKALSQIILFTTFLGGYQGVMCQNVYTELLHASQQKDQRLDKYIGPIHGLLRTPANNQFLISKQQALPIFQ